jgi:ribosomal protein S19
MLISTVKLTNHAHKRIVKRFGINGRSATKRFAETVVTKGRILPSVASNIIYEHNGHTYIFVETKDTETNNPILLMITACNDDKSSEWKMFHHGKVHKIATTKQSHIHRDSPLRKTAVNEKYKNNFYDLHECV